MPGKGALDPVCRLRIKDHRGVKVSETTRVRTQGQREDGRRVMDEGANDSSNPARGAPQLILYSAGVDLGRG